MGRGGNSKNQVMGPKFKEHRLVFPVLVFLVSLCVGAGVFSVYRVLGEAGKYLDAHTQSWVIALTRTENHVTDYQEMARAYFLNPTTADKEQLKLLNGIIRARRNMIDPVLFKNQVPDVLKKELKGVFGYYDQAVSSLNILLNTPGSPKPEQEEIEGHLRSLEDSMAFIYTESVIAAQNIASARQASLRNLSFTI
ncbi:MAG: hypothetical protein ACI845_003822, partial [Gammaproteobacteria bacterium]